MATEAGYSSLKVLTALASAFDKLQLEEGVSIHEADVIDSYGTEEQRAVARLRDTEVHWRDVPVRELEDMYWVWSYFDAKGFRFYLPALLTWWAHAYPEADASAITSVLNSLARKPDDDFYSITEEQLRLLSYQQLEIILIYLEWLAETDKNLHNEARQAAKRFRQKLA